MQRQIVICAAAALTAAAAHGAEPYLDLDSLIEEAVAENPSLEVLQHRLKAAEERAAQAGALMDPVLRLDFSNVPLSDLNFDSTPMSGRQISLSQHFPYPGKRAARERMANHAAATVAAARKDRAGAVVNLVKQAYFDLAFLDRAIEIAQRNDELLRDFVRIAQTKYAVGRSPQQDVLKAQVSLSSLRERLLVMRQKRRRTEAQLNATLNRAPGVPLGRTPAIEQTAFTFEAEQLQEMAQVERPILLGLRETIERWRVMEQLALKEYRPDFDVSAAYRQRDFTADPVSGSDFVSVGLKFNLPIFQGRKQDRKVAEARALIRATEAELEAKRLEIAVLIEQLHIDADTHAQETALFRDVIIPQADQSLAAAIAGYQVNEVDFLTLLNNQVTLLNFEIDYYRHLSAYEKTLARLESAVGKRLF